MATTMTDADIREALEQLDSCLETLPTEYRLTGPEGELAATLEAGHLDRLKGRLRRYAALLLDHNRRVNLTAITDGEGICRRHFWDALTLLPLIDRVAATQASRQGPLRLVDVGTGAGLPGLILALARPELEVVLNDSLKKRLHFLDLVIEALELPNVRTVHARAEDLGRDPEHRAHYDIVTARAVAALPVLAEYCLPLCREGGVWLAPKTLREGPDTMRRALKVLGGGEPEVWTAPDASDSDYCIYETAKLNATPKAYPRKAGTPAKKPL